ncbi:hypothetical protein FC62_GL001341 [Amylolactobacillus amylotrophicus DSM 20534]|uniref:Uncharacterized protein n=3 Tax=Amylolactobacillus TaxID=2767876 RepID=A0A1L6XAV9_9LACO|nr:MULTISPECIES: hypothetical protein [Amylolactobacillus]APT18115.1 hypothetical protein LA20533_01935 [Amylolactobacillus amylophilus DSM 20533 = JCM 1125]KRK37463.1 hypothetical protein FC62_GL001341 [Amylolactobacillus amylotrophicus DSM 20534]KRM42136.1 hypothetical protein FD40_GL000920 [Amylolactobacillus amylophilus DSM 20533 = JCM 1125]GED80523.1 hypothetical protein LAM01_09960 [Amylolactobacillus amylophilus]
MEKLSDLELIELTRQKNSDALVELCARYQPMIRGVIRRYFLRSYDYLDWQQDAMFICYESAVLFDENMHVRFGGFFQLRFLQHAKSLVRFELAKKRAPYSEALSLESQVTPSKKIRDKIIKNDVFMISESSASDVNITQLEMYIDELSLTELVAFRMNIGVVTQAEALKILDCTPTQLIAARDRCRQKFKKIV